MSNVDAITLVWIHMRYKRFYYIFFCFITLDIVVFSFAFLFFNIRPFFEDHWKNYLSIRKITDGESEPVFPDPYGVQERDDYYKSISYSGLGGASGHDSTIIA